MKKNIKTIITHNLPEFNDFSHKLSILIQESIEKGSLVIYFHGDLGAGKTFLIKNLLEKICPASIVKSPTYSIVEEYQLESKQRVLHFDLYRLSDPEELEYIGIRDYMNDFKLMLIEWPSKGAGYILPADLNLNIDFLNNDSEGRQYSLESLSAKGLDLLNNLI